MGTTDPVEVALAFTKAINSHDPDRLVALATDNHTLVDALGQSVSGRDAVGKAWRAYFELFPDYRVTVDSALGEGGVAGLFGHASGSFHRRNWTIPAAWRAVIKRGKVREWRVYADNEPVWKLLGVKRY
jgi:ketosteroid isomerase-like protein